MALILSLVFSFFVYAEDKYMENVEEINQMRIEHQNDILEVFEKFGITPEAVNSVLFGNEMPTDLNKQIGALTKNMKNIENTLGESALDDNTYKAMKSQLKDLRKLAYASERIAEEQAQMPNWQKKAIAITMPVAKKVAATFLNPDVLEKAFELKKQKKVKRLFIFNAIFVLLIMLYTYFTKKRGTKLLIRMRNSLLTTLFLFVGTSAIIPTIVYGKTYIEFMSAVNKSAIEQFKKT